MLFIYFYCSFQQGAVMHILFFHSQVKPAQARGRKGHEGEGICEEDDACTSEQLPNDKQPEDHPDAYSQDHTVSTKKKTFGPHEYVSTLPKTLSYHSIFKNYRLKS